jgi:hypothetical protein
MSSTHTRYVGYHVLTGLALAALVLTGCTEEDSTPTEPVAPAVSSNIEEDQPRPETVPSPPVDDAPTVVEPVRQIPEPQEDKPEPVDSDTNRGIYGPEDCDTANTTTPMTQAEWMANCYEPEPVEVPTTPADEAHTDGGDGWPEGEPAPPLDECIGFGCDPEQDAELLEGEIEANAGY